MKAGLVSVIIPYYNNAPFIKKCVQSVLDQTYNDIEIIIVDDGSTDDAEIELRTIYDPRLKSYIKLPENMGVSAARNRGIEAASGEFIIFVDGDDWIEPEHIALLVDGLNKADSAMIIMQTDKPDGIEVNKEVKALFESRSRLSKSDIHMLLECYLLSSPCDKIYRSSLLKKRDQIRFDSKVSYAEDLLFNLQYFSNINSVNLINRVTYHYVRHGVESGSTRYHKNTSYTLSRIYDEFYKCIPIKSIGAITIILRLYLWGIINLYHPSSSMVAYERKSELTNLIQSDGWKKSRSALWGLNVNPLLKLILFIGSPSLIEMVMNRKLH